MKVNKQSYENLHYGRQRIILPYSEVTSENLEEVMKKALNIHSQNASDCDYLIHYFLGDQDILGRPNSGTSNINNTTVVNHAFPITREIVGYTLGNQVEFTQKKLEDQEDVSKISDIYNYEFSYYVDICSAIYASICGVGYQITLPSSDINKDNTPEIPITYTYLDPRTTFVVQSSDIGNHVILSGYYFVNPVTKKREYTCYTNKYKFEFSNMDMRTLKMTPNIVGLNPITMVENSVFLTGDWEQAISVMNASNQIASDSLNDIEGTIKSLLVILGAEFQDGEEDTSISRIKNNRVLTLTRGTGDASNLDAKFIAPKLESVSVENIRKYLEDARNVITGIPDRKGNSSGGDTGQAVLNRDGWTDIEIVARLKELFFKKAKKQQLAVGIKILKMLGMISKDLSVVDIDLSIGRHSQDNLQTKTQAFATLVATGELAVIDCLELANLTNKTREIVERGKKEKAERQAEELERAKQTQKVLGTNEPTTDNKNTAQDKKQVANKTNKK